MISPEKGRVGNSDSLVGLICQWIPLALSDLIMALGDPLQISAISRLENPKAGLAAMGIIKALANFLESPIIMILHASTALSGDRRARLALARFSLLLGLAASGVFLATGLPGIREFLFLRVFGSDLKVVLVATEALLWMSLWPALIAWRRYYQGILINSGQGRWLGWASLGRLTAFAGLLGVGFWQCGTGPTVAARALIGGLAAEAILAQMFAYRSGSIASFRSETDESLPQSLSQVVYYYFPLASTMVLVWGGRAALVAIVARAVDGPLALACWPAAWNLLILVANCTRMVQQIIISRARHLPFSLLIRFAAIVGIGASCVMLGLAFTSAGPNILFHLLGKQSDLFSIALPVVQIGCLLPLIVATQNALQGFCIALGQNWRVQKATLAGLTTTLTTTAILVWSGHSGTVSAIWGMMVGLVVELLLLSRVWPDAEVFRHRVNAVE